MKRILLMLMASLAMTCAVMAADKGEAAPDFTLKDTAGKEFTLSSLRGKWVVIDFWGSWCRWCIKGFPEMKKYYAAHKSKLEIVGVDCGDTEATWQNAVKYYSLPWINVYEPGTDAAALPARYGVQGFPTKVIVDPKGVIHAVFVGETPDFYTELDGLLK